MGESASNRREKSSMYPERLGDYVFAEREKTQMSRRVFAQRVGLDPSTVEDIENGYTKSPGLKAILAIADGLKISPMKLIAVYKGQDPDLVNDSQQLEASIVDFVESLPPHIKARACRGIPDPSIAPKAPPPGMEVYCVPSDKEDIDV